jgi:hypothetical protein
VVGFLCDFWAGIVGWTLVTELITLVWFFPLVYMDVTGFEGMVVAYFLPAPLLASRAVRRVLVWNRAVLLLLALPGVWCLQFMPELVPRLAVLAACTGLALTAMMGSWWIDHVRPVSYPWACADSGRVL